MPRRGRITKRDVLPDPLYGSKLVTKLVNNVMYDGKKGVAQKIVYDAFAEIEEKLPLLDPVNVGKNGHVKEYREEKAKEREIQDRHYKNQQKEIARMEAFIAQQKRWNREKNIKTAESKQKVIDRIEETMVKPEKICQ